MAAPHHYYHRINANSAEQYRDVQVRDFNADASHTEAHIQSLLTHRTPLLTGRWDHGDENITIDWGWFTMFCTDGERRDIKTWFDEEGKPKSLIPNHRANAIIDAGRFTSQERTKISNNRNQNLKDHCGCNFIYGDLICEIPIGTPGPDHTVYGNNPLWSVMQPREPPAEMIDKHGQDMAVNKLSPMRKYNIPATLAAGTPVWEDTTYFAAPRVCSDVEFKTLLQLWGVTPDELARLFLNLEGPQEYATTLQFTREWSRLDQTDKDSIWRLPQRPGTANSACYTPQGTEITADQTFEMVFGNKPQTPERQDFIRLMKDWEVPPCAMLFVDFAFGRHHSSRGVVQNVPLSREAFQAMTQSEEGTETVQLASTRAETKRIGSVIMKAVVMMLDSTDQPAKCESCDRPADDMKGFVCFKPHRDNDGGRFIASDEWFHCDSVVCQDRAEFNSKRGDEREEASELRAGDESAMFLVPGNNSEDDIKSLIDLVNSQMGPGAAIASELGNGMDTVRVDHTEAVFSCESIAEPIKFRVPYKKYTSVDPHLKFPGYMSLERARAAGFIGNEVSDETRNEYIREMIKSAVAKVFEEHKLTCSVCLSAAATGYAFRITYIPSLDGSKGTFVPGSKERWVCESQNCLARAGKGVQKDMKKIGLREVCSNCGKNDEENQRCARCRKVYYCSRQCQVTHWVHHKAMCNSIKKLNAAREKGQATS